MKHIFAIAVFLSFLSSAVIGTLRAAPGDQWNSGNQFHSSSPGAPVQKPGNPATDNPWAYGFRMARGYNDGKWTHMDAGPFQPFDVFDELGPGVFGAADSGPDLNRWWVPFPPPEGQVCVGRLVHAEGAVETGPEKYLEGQVHLLTDDDAPTTGIVSLRWQAPEGGVYNVVVELENRLDVDDKAQRDPFYNLVINDVVIGEGHLEGFGKRERLSLEGVTLSAGDAVEICASTGGITFPFALLAADVTIQQVADAMARPLPKQLRIANDKRAQGPEPMMEAQAGHPYQASMAKAAQWSQENLGPDAIGLPISFIYDGRPMFRSPYNGAPLPPDALRGWKSERTWQRLDENRVQKTISYRDLKTDLEVRLEMVEYHDFPVVEWVVYFKNLGTGDTPILEQILPLNVQLDAARWLLHHNAGSFPGAASYAPFSTPIEKGRMLTLGAFSGRPSDTEMPYFNLEQDKDGLILAVGWPGQWETSFMRADGNSLHVRSGQELTHLVLRPGEEIRTPLTALLFRSGGDWIDGQNVWRRWMVQHNMPRPAGKPLAPIFSGQVGYFMDWMYKATEENQKQYIDRFIKLGIDIDHWWMDTGWYTPLWEPVPDRFPNGIGPISAHARDNGIKTILWFEPERIVPGSPVRTDHPEWVLDATTTDQGLLNLGDPAAREWITNHISKVLADNGIRVFRSDFNMDPLDHWRQNDAPDRQGITENHYCQGYLAFWDGLLEKNPELLIDSCASGGRRNDLETLRRSVPLWKCDYAVEPTGMQSQTYGLAMWIPYFGNCGGQIDKYVFRSNMFPAVTKGAWEDRSPTRDIREDNHDYGLLRELIAQWRRVSPHYLADYYPLTPYSLDQKNVWIGWQFHDPELGAGVVHAFRRPGEESNARQQFVLRGLEANTHYRIENFDSDGARTMTGAELMGSGLQIELNAAPGAAVVAYEKTE